MDENWKPDHTLGLTANNLGEKVIEMYDSCGLPVPGTYFDPEGPTKSSPSPNARQTFIKNFILDAEDFTSPDPQKVLEEYYRLQKAANATGTEGSEPAIHLHTANTLILANWEGAAAIAFGEQMEKIANFMDQQQTQLVYAMQAMGTAFGLAVQFRQSYFDMANSTIEACRAVIAKRPPEPSLNSFMFSLGSDMVNLAVGAIGAKNPKELVKVGVDWFKQAFEKAKEPAAISGDDATKVLYSYLAARDRLRESFENGLKSLADWCDHQRSEYFSLPVPILEPLPACTDVRSPDFSYEKFANDGHAVKNFGPKVEQERRKFAEENPRSEGPIHRRLKGEE